MHHGAIRVENRKMIPYLQDVDSGKCYELQGRIVTFGTSPESTIPIAPPGPDRCGHCLFFGGSYHFQPLTQEFTVMLNGSRVSGKVSLHQGDLIHMGKTRFRFFDRRETALSTTDRDSKPDMVSELLNMVLLLLRDRDGNIASGLLSAITRLFRGDAARIVGEEENGGRRYTLVRYPEHLGLDRFSNRAIDWAKDASHTVLLRETDWADTPKSSRSLEMNAVSSVLCAPLCSGEKLKGYLYLDRINKGDPFSEMDRELCDRLLPLFAELLANSDERRRQSELITALQKTQEHAEGGIVHRSERMRSLLSMADRIAVSDAPVLISGETGTGKELLARHIHARSSRVDKPFKAINCGAIPENLIESELFGHEKGAFTGAHARRSGLFESANGGTVLTNWLKCRLRSRSNCLEYCRSPKSSGSARPTL